MPEPPHVLVVDDEPSLLLLMQKYLTRLGYSVDACGRARDALDLFAAQPKRYSAVIADLNLPDMSGEDLLHKILKHNPQIRILVCSGYPFDVSSLPSLREQQICFLQKPFLPKMLAETIRDLLGTESSSA